MLLGWQMGYLAYFSIPISEKNNFLMFGFTMENIKEKKIKSNFLKILQVFKIS